MPRIASRRPGIGEFPPDGRKIYRVLTHLANIAFEERRQIVLGKQ
jgi:hypothetical protein